MRYTCYPLRITPIPFTNRIIPFSHESNRIPIHHINTLTHQNNPVLHKSGYNCVYTSHRIIRIIKSKNRVNMPFSTSSLLYSSSYFFRLQREILRIEVENKQNLSIFHVHSICFHVKESTFPVIKLPCTHQRIRITYKYLSVFRRRIPVLRHRYRHSRLFLSISHMEKQRRTRNPMQEKQEVKGM